MRDTLAGRTALILLATLVCLQLIAGAVLLWPASLLSVAPALPGQTALIVEALDGAPAPARPAIARALNAASASVRLHDRLPAAGDLRLDDDPALRARYQAALGDRAFRIESRAASGLAALRRSDRPGLVRVTVELRDGSHVSIEKSVRAPLRGLTGQGALLGALIGLTVIGSLLVSFRETARPVANLARATRAFMDDEGLPDLEARGPREVRDLAEALNAMRRQVRALVEDRTRILAAIAHDMRTYLTRVRLRVELLEDPHERAQAVGDVAEMATLLDDTLLYAWAGAGAGDDGSAAGDLDLKAEIDSFCAIREAMGDAVACDSPADAVRVKANPVAVRRILNNLVDNALRFGNSARISLAVGGTRAEIRVDDDGPGIAEALRETVQAPFVRLEPSRGRHAGGAGLGLAIVRALAAAQGGALQLTEADSGGLRAVVSLPLSRPGPHAPETVGG